MSTPELSSTGATRRPLLVDAGYGLLGWVLPLGVTVIAVPLVIRWLGASGYAAYAVALAYGSTAATFGPTRGIIHQLARTGGAADRASTIRTAYIAAVVMGVSSALLFAALAAPLSAATGQDMTEVSRASLLLAASSAVPAAVFAASLAVLQGIGRLDLLAACSVAASVLSSLCVAAAAWWLGSATAAVAAQLLTTALAAAGGVWLVLRHADAGGGTFSWPATRHLVGFSASALGAQLLLSVWALAERVLVGRFLGAAALTAFILPVMLGAYLQAAVVAAAQVLSSARHTEPAAGGRSGVHAGATKLAAIVAICGAAGIAGAGQAFLELWVGDSIAAAAAPALLPIAVAFGVNAISSVCWFENEGDGEPGRNIALTLAWTLAGTIGLIVLAPRYGVLGAGLARIAAQLLTPFAIVWFEYRSGRHQPGLWPAILLWVLPPGIALGVALRVGLAAAAPSWTMFAAASTLGSLLFATVVWWAPVFDANERAALRRWLQATLARVAGQR